MNRTATLTIAVLAAATVAAPGALAAPKPITKTYTATAPMPDPSNFAPGAAAHSVCGMNVPQSFHTEKFKVPAAGSLKVTLNGYQGDWDLLLLDAKDKELGYSGELPLEDEVVQVKFKKATEVKIISCNWAGGPTGTVTYEFKYK